MNRDKVQLWMSGLGLFPAVFTVGISVVQLLIGSEPAAGIWSGWPWVGLIIGLVLVLLCFFGWKGVARRCRFWKELL